MLLWRVSLHQLLRFQALEDDANDENAEASYTVAMVAVIKRRLSVWWATVHWISK